MTRSILIAVALFAFHAVGCASSADTTAIVSSEDEASGTTLDLVETHQDGVVEIEVTVQRAGEYFVDSYAWPETEEPPPALIAALAELEAPLLDNAWEIESPDQAPQPSCEASRRFADVRWPGRTPTGDVGCPQDAPNGAPSFQRRPIADGDAGPAPELAAAADEDTLPPSVQVTYVWPELLEEAAHLRIETERLQAPAFDGCDESEGFTDCLRAAR